MKFAYGAQAFGEVSRLALFQGGVLPLFALMVGAGNAHLGLLSGMPNGLIALTYIVSPLVARYGKRRWLVALLALGSVASLGLFLVYPVYNAWGSSAAVTTLILLVFLQAGLTGMSFAGWWPLLNDVIPPDMIGLFFGRLRTIIEASGLLILLLTSGFLGKNPPVWRFLIVFRVGSIGLFLRAYFMSRLPDPVGADPGVSISITQHLTALRRPLRDRPFFYFCTVVFVLNFLISVPLPLYVPYLKLSRAFPTSLTIASVAGLSMGGVISLIPWGKYADHQDVNSLFLKAILPLAILHVLLALIPQYQGTSWLPIGMAAICSIGVGVGMAGYGIAFTSYVFHHTPRAYSSTYMGLQIFAEGLAAFTGSLTGGILADTLSDWVLHMATLSLDNYQVIFIGCALLLLPALLLLRGLRPGEEMQFESR